MRQTFAASVATHSNSMSPCDRVPDEKSELRRHPRQRALCHFAETFKLLEQDRTEQHMETGWDGHIDSRRPAKSLASSSSARRHFKTSGFRSGQGARPTQAQVKARDLETQQSKCFRDFVQSRAKFIT